MSIQSAVIIFFIVWVGAVIYTAVKLKDYLDDDC